MGILELLIIVLILVWLFGGLPRMAGWGNGFGGNQIHFVWIIVIILVILLLTGHRF
jgi:hypothetical protein